MENGVARNYQSYKSTLQRRKQRGRERWVKNLGSGDTNTIWTVTTEGGTEGGTERLLHPAKLRRRRRMSKQRKGQRRKQERKRREGDKGSKEGRSIIDGFVAREQNKNALHVC